MPCCPLPNRRSRARFGLPRRAAFARGVKALAVGFLVREAKRLGRGNPKSGGRRSLRKIAAELAKIGEALAATGLPSAKEAARAYFARNGQPYSAKGVRAMLAQRLPGGPRSVNE